MFGDHYAHNQNKAQLTGYVNRYGPGLVIYWFGHLADLEQDQDVVLCSELPTDFVVL